jgi:hypothetical protein
MLTVCFPLNNWHNLWRVLFRISVKKQLVIISLVSLLNLSWQSWFDKTATSSALLRIIHIVRFLKIIPNNNIQPFEFNAIYLFLSWLGFRSYNIYFQLHNSNVILVSVWNVYVLLPRIDYSTLMFWNSQISMFLIPRAT